MCTLERGSVKVVDSSIFESIIKVNSSISTGHILLSQQAIIFHLSFNNRRSLLRRLTILNSQASHAYTLCLVRPEHIKVFAL